MTLFLYVEVLLQGVLTGLVYGLMAPRGLSVIFGVVRVVNFAHGEFAVLAMYSTFVLFTLLHIDPILAAIPAAALSFSSAGSCNALSCSLSSCGRSTTNSSCSSVSRSFSSMRFS